MKNLVLALSLAACSGLSQATVLTFNDLSLSNYDDIPGTYGDKVKEAGPPDPAVPEDPENPTPPGSYGIGNGFTPNVSIEYRTWRISTGTVAYENLEFWSTSYGDLVNVAFPVTSSDHFGEISLIAEPGWSVKLNSFDLAGYPGVDKINKVRIIDGNGTELFLDESAAILGAGGTHSTFSPDLTAQILRVQFAFNDWNIAIDNVNFDQTPVPVPAGLYLLGSGLLSLAATVRRKRRAGV